MALSLSCADGKSVITKDGRRLGVLIGATVDTSNWSTTALQVETSKETLEELGRKKPLMRPATVAFRVNAVGAVGDVIQLNVEMKNLRDYLLA